MHRRRDTNLGMGFYDSQPARPMRLFCVGPKEIMLLDLQLGRGCLGVVGLQGFLQSRRPPGGGRRRGGDGGHSGWHIGKLYAGSSLGFVHC